MGIEFMEMVERLRGQKLTSDEKDMFIRMKEELRCSDEDAIWQVISVLEYQKTFYLDLQTKFRKKPKRFVGKWERSLKMKWPLPRANSWKAWLNRPEA